MTRSTAQRRSRASRVTPLKDSLSHSRLTERPHLQNVRDFHYVKGRHSYNSPLALAGMKNERCFSLLFFSSSHPSHYYLTHQSSPLFIAQSHPQSFHTHRYTLSFPHLFIRHLFTGSTSQILHQMDLLRSPFQWLHNPLAISTVVQEEPVHDDDVHVIDMEEGLAMAAEPLALYIMQPSNSSTDTSPPSVPSCTIKAIPGKGVGLVATRPIQAGEKIISESPLIRLKLSELGYYRLEWEVKRLSTRQQSDFWKLHHTGMEEMPGLFEIWTKNSFSSGDQHQAIFSVISRINNSCTPNASVSWADGHKTKKQHESEEWGSMSVIAGRDIAQGEEITVCYTSVLHSRNARNEILQHAWEFACRCHSCSLKGEELLDSERRRRRAASILDALDYEDQDVKGIFELVKQGLEVLQEEKLHTPLFSMSWFAYQYAALYELTDEAEHWAGRAYEHSKLVNGEDHPSTLAARYGMHTPTFYPASKGSWMGSVSACVVA